MALSLLLLAPWAVSGVQMQALPMLTRKLKTKVAPVYPELARKLNLSGVVRIEITVSPKGEVTATKAVGGHPVLVGAALEAVKKWRYETASEVSTGIVELWFDAGQQ